MDEYKQYLYDRNRTRYNNIDEGDLTHQKSLRDKLKCKSFKWYIENIAYDLVERFPLIEPPHKAFGVIRSIADPILCIDSLFNNLSEKVGMYDCDEDLKYPSDSQYWGLTWYRDIRELNGIFCLVLDRNSINSNNTIPVILYFCHNQQKGQAWRYDETYHWIVHEQSKKCLDYETQFFKVFVDDCNKTRLTMKWEWGFYNKTAIVKVY